MNKLTKIYEGMVDDHIIKPELICKDDYEQHQDDPNVVVFKRFKNFIDEEGEQQSIAYYKVDITKIDEKIYNQYIPLKNHEHISTIRYYIEILFIGIIISIAIIIILIILFFN